MSKKIRNLIILVIIVGLGYGAYVMFVAKKTPVGTLSNANQSATASVGDQKALRTGQDLLILLNNLKTITLDTSIFSDESEAFGRLEDYSVIIERDKNPGRINPFAPLGIDVGPMENTANATGTLIAGAPQDDIIFPPLAGGEPGLLQGGADLAVSTKDATNVAITSAKLNAELLVANNSTTRWFEWGKTADAMLSNSAPFAQKTTGVFGYIATGLSSNTKYYYRAVVKTDGVVTQGTTLSFTTK